MSIKKSIEDLLKAGAPMQLSQITAALDLPKTAGPEVSATLVKLRNSGSLVISMAARLAGKGPRFVKVYAWRKTKGPAQDVDVRRYLSGVREL